MHKNPLLKISLLFIGTTLSAFAVQATDKAVPADNTGVNERDRSAQTLTPEDQSQTKSDIELAAAVRRAVVAQSGLSVAGQNIKIITQNGRVTLRGPVKDDAELATIEKTVRQAAGKAHVDNQLEVK